MKNAKHVVCRSHQRSAAPILFACGFIVGGLTSTMTWLFLGTLQIGVAEWIVFGATSATVLISGAVLFPQAYARHEQPSPSDATQIIQIRRAMDALLAKLSASFSTQHSQATEELTQMRSLLSNAANMLVSNFTSLDADIRRQQNLILSVGESGRGFTEIAAEMYRLSTVLEHCSEPARAELAEVVARAQRINQKIGDAVAYVKEIGGQVASEVSRTITSLQFQDLATQLTTRVNDRIDAMSNTLRALTQIREANFKVCSLSDLSDYLQQHQTALSRIGTLGPTAKRPVSQGGMTCVSICFKTQYIGNIRWQKQF